MPGPVPEATADWLSSSVLPVVSSAMMSCVDSAGLLVSRYSKRSTGPSTLSAMSYSRTRVSAFTSTKGRMRSRSVKSRLAERSR